METSESIIISDSDDQEKDNDIMEIEDILPKNNLTIAEEKKNEGNDHYKAQNYHAALRLYSDAITLCPDTAAFYGNRAACHMMLGDYKAALNDSRQAISIDSKFEKGYVRMAKCCLSLGDMVGVEQAINKLMEVDAKNTSLRAESEQIKLLRSLDEKALQCFEKADYRTAVYHVDSALKIAPACLRYKLLKAESLALLGRTEQANDMAVSCMKADASSADAVYVRGLCLYYGDNLEKGLLHFQRALALDPDHANAKLMRIKAKTLKEKKENGNALFKGGKYREAQFIYTEALAIDPINADTNSKLYYNRALVNSKIGNIRDAIADCSSAFAANSNYLKAIMLRAKCHNDMQNYEECVKDYETAFKMEKSVEIRRCLKDAKLALKKSKRKDYYKILGIDKRASDDEIKKAYRKRALVHHPDRHANASEDEKREQEKKFKEVGEAYAILSDQQKRDRYDNGQDLDEQEFDPTQMYSQFFHFSSEGGQTFSFF